MGVGTPLYGDRAPTIGQYVVIAASTLLDNERVLTGTANQIVVTDGGAGSTVVLSVSSTLLIPGTLTVPNTGLHLLDTNASHDLIIAPGSDLTADRQLTLTTGDAARTVTLSGNPTLNDWFDQSVKIAATPTFGGMTLEGAQIIDVTNAEALLVRKDADGGDVFTVDTINAVVAIGVAPSIGNKLRLYNNSTGTGAFYGIHNQMIFTPSGSHTGGAYAAYCNVQSAGSQAFTDLLGMFFLGEHKSSGNLASGFGLFARFDANNASSTVADLRAIYANARNIAGGTVTLATAVRAGVAMAHASGTIITGAGVYIDSASNTGTLTTNYGLYIGTQTAGSTNHAIYTNAGLNRLGDQLSVVGSADRIQTIIKANATQTANILEIQNSAAAAVQLALAGNGRDFVLDTTTGTKIGTATTQKLGLWNATPIVQPAGAAQAAPAAYATGAFGLDSDANMQALYDLVVAMRTALVNSGIIKGAA